MPHPIATVNGGLMGLLLKPGEYHVVFDYQNRYFGTTLLVTACGLVLFLIVGGMEILVRRKKRSVS